MENTYFKTILVFYDVVYDGVAPRSAITAELKKITKYIIKKFCTMLHFSKTKVSSFQNHPARPEAGKSVQKPIKPNASHREFFGGKRREYGRKRDKHERLGKPL